jgi:hypothetical protein
VSHQDATSAGLHGRPTAWELVDAVRTFLQAELSEGVPGPDLSDGARRHQMRIAVHALEVVGRELVLGPSQEADHQERLRNLGFVDDASLAQAIRTGGLDDGPELRRALREDTRDRLLVANPGWLPADRE